jgi:hypothetical protein
MRILKAARVISGCAVFAAIFFSWLFAFTLSNRLRIHHNRDQYRPAIFTVDDAVYIPARGDDSKLYWLTGTVADEAERLVPRLPTEFKLLSAADLLSLYPHGSTIEVLYNPRETETIIQGETLRVLHFTPDFWRREEHYLNKLLCFVLLPLPLALLAYLTFRYFHNRSLTRRNVQAAQPGAATSTPSTFDRE